MRVLGESLKNIDSAVALLLTASQAVKVVEGHASSIVEKCRPDLGPYETIYRHVHANPELSTQEAETAALADRHLKTIGYQTVTGIGGTGLVGILRNGKGPTILLRSELDGLPILEDTGLPYASKKQMLDLNGKLVPVMHGCGHDMHFTALLAASDLLYCARAKWSGTLLILFQPAEEAIGGAQLMVDDGLYKRVPVPDVLLAQHIGVGRAGDFGVLAGPVSSSQDAFDIRIFGRGGHASEPENCIDPVVTAAYIIVRLQSIVSREVPPDQPAVVTCGSIKAGTATNIIPEWADIKLDVRTYDEKVRAKIHKAIERIIKAECQASGAEKEPEIKRVDATPALVNDKATAETIQTLFKAHFGKEKMIKISKGMGSEDFGVLAKPINRPCVMWTLGCTDQKQWDDAVKNGSVAEIPVNHSSKFAPAIQPTLKTAVDALSVAALKLFGLPDEGSL